ncbi:MAG TPA: CoA transferase [Burkholderiales bacterium]|nr:CoA transferase [Burkholderiales bacterium]
MTPEQLLASTLWQALGGAPGAAQALEFAGPAGGLPSKFEVSTLACATIGVATLAAAELWAKRRGEPPRRVTVDRRLAAAAFRCERLLKPEGWTLPEIWDPIAGDYRAADGWIRLHTNYVHHRQAVLRVLGVAEEKEAVAQAVARRHAEELQDAVVEAGGAAASMRTIEAWARYPQGAALAAEPIVAREGRAGEMKERAAPAAPLAGVRVLDMTRVIAGPVGTRHLAAYGAEVLRIDPPGFEEMGALLPDMTRGKRCAALDLSTPEGRAALERLVAEADMLVHGHRPGALDRLGLTPARLRALNPALVLVRSDAWGWSGPWAARRGFDSLVQMSTGIAHPGSDGKPTPLPAQALDHATGYLIAAAACRALADRCALSRLALARTAKLLVDLGQEGDPAAPGLGNVEDLLERSATAWGPVKQVPCAAAIEGFEVRWPVEAGPLGRHAAHWFR